MLMGDSETHACTHADNTHNTHAEEPYWDRSLLNIKCHLSLPPDSQTLTHFSRMTGPGSRARRDRLHVPCGTIHCGRYKVWKSRVYTQHSFDTPFLSLSCCITVHVHHACCFGVALMKHWKRKLELSLSLSTGCQTSVVVDAQAWHCHISLKRSLSEPVLNAVVSSLLCSTYTLVNETRHALTLFNKSFDMNTEMLTDRLVVLIWRVSEVF